MKSKHYQKWLINGGVSAVLMGAGLSMMIDAAFWRYEQVAFWRWFTYGTFALCVFMAGTSFFGAAIYSRLRYEAEKN